MNLLSFTKKEKLTRKRQIQLLFAQGSTLRLPLLRVYYLRYHTKTQKSHQVLFAIPKTTFKKAIHRNTIKRRLREAYRLSKHQIQSTHQQYFLLGYVYIGKNIKQATYTALLANVQQSLTHLQQWLKKQKKDKPTI